jgi:hypothetical protein
VRVEHRQQRERDARGLGGRGDARGHLGRIRVRPAIGLVVHVVEFAHAREPALEHVDVRLRGDGLDVVGRHARHEAVHELAPAPEVVRLRPAILGESGHAALEAVAVHVRHAGQHDAGNLVAGLRRYAALHRCEFSARDAQPHVPRPAVGQQRARTVDGMGFGRQVHCLTRLK